MPMIGPTNSIIAVLEENRPRATRMYFKTLCEKYSETITSLVKIHNGKIIMNHP